MLWIWRIDLVYKSSVLDTVIKRRRKTLHWQSTPSCVGSFKECRITKQTEVRSLMQLVTVIYVFDNKIRYVYRKSGNEARIYKVIENCPSVCRLKFTLGCFMTPKPADKNQWRSVFLKSRESSLKSRGFSRPGPAGLVSVAAVRFYEMI